jgi:ParB family chromosome partitioning protein
MQIMKVDPRALKDNPDRRASRSPPQADALLLATIKAVGIVQPPVVAPETDGGNGYIIDAGHRRVKQAIAAGLEEIEVLVVDAANDNGAMRSMVENIAREPLNPVDQWRAIERLVALGWTEEAIAVALALPVRQIRKLRLLANVLPAMLDQMAKGDMPNEQQLRTIAAASLDEQKEVWKAHKPKKGDPQVSWWQRRQGLTKTRMYARDASFGDDLAQAYGIEWVEDLFAPADEDSSLHHQCRGLPRRPAGVDDAEPAEEGRHRRGPTTGARSSCRRRPSASTASPASPTTRRCTSIATARCRPCTTACRRRRSRKARGRRSTVAMMDASSPKPRPDVTRKGIEMIGDFRTDALHEALSRAPIEDDTLMALLVLAFAGTERLVSTPARRRLLWRQALGGMPRAVRRGGQARLRQDTLRIAARSC